MMYFHDGEIAVLTEPRGDMINQRVLAGTLLQIVGPPNELGLYCAVLEDGRSFWVRDDMIEKRTLH